MGTKAKLAVLIFVLLHSGWTFARSLKPVEFAFRDEKMKFGCFAFPVTLSL